MSLDSTFECARDSVNLDTNSGGTATAAVDSKRFKYITWGVDNVSGDSATNVIELQIQLAVSGTWHWTGSTITKSSDVNGEADPKIAFNISGAYQIRWIVVTTEAGIQKIEWVATR